MSTPDADDRRAPYSLVDSISATPLVHDRASPPLTNDLPPRQAPSGLFPRGTVFGAFVGMFFGALTGAVLSWMSDDNDHLWIGATIGVGMGFVGGAMIGGVERWRRGDFVRPDFATMIGGIFGLAVAIFAFLSGIGSVHGNLTRFGLIGIAMAFPMASILIGGLFDRSYEAARNSKRRDAAVYCVFAIGASLGLIGLMIAYPTGTSAEDLVRPLKGLIYTEIREEREFRDAVIKNVVLVRMSNNTYSGSFDIVVKDRTQRYHVNAQMVDEILSAQWRPIDH